MASTTAGRTAPIPSTVLCTLVAQGWSAFLTMLDFTGDDRMAVAMAPTLLQAKLMLWLEDELTRSGLYDGGEIVVDQKVRKVS